MKLTSQLRRFFPTLGDCEEAAGSTVAEVLAELDRRYPGLRGYLVDDRGALRQHVNIFIGNDMIRDRDRLGDRVGDEDTVSVFQALSGGAGDSDRKRGGNDGRE